MGSFALVVAAVFFCNAHAEYLTTYLRGNTSKVLLKQGILQGVVVGFRTNYKLAPVEQYRGIPYAEPPVGEFRFMPPGSAPGFGIRTMYANTYGPACPQRFPDVEKMTPERRSAFLRLQQYLRVQSEDCLYLNVYAPFRGNSKTARTYPVMVFIHGESFEWNSGNPYDGSVLASYGNVVVVTLNYRLGVLGFLKPGTEEYSTTNFGLVDQIAALVWVKDNIAAFGGDPDSVTLFGHGTGAICASLLMLSPMVLQEHNKTLFQRAILMSGSALSDSALAGNPLHVSYQVAQGVNCQIDDDFAACLRRKRLEDIMDAPISSAIYRTAFGPLVDSRVVPNEPEKLMSTYNDVFRRFSLMLGVTEQESLEHLPPDALHVGMLEKERDVELRRYLRVRCEMRPEVCLTRTLEEYTRSEISMDESYSGHEPDRASLARDALIDILSDARVVAPMMKMAKYHSQLNQETYFYVFAHRTLSREHVRDKTSTGDELPYLFGVPLVGSSFHFNEHYTERERLFSEVVMTYFTNFAYTGDPKIPRKEYYHTLDRNEWIKFDVDWPPYTPHDQSYLHMGIPPYRMRYYRYEKVKFWNEIIPEISSTNSTVFHDEKPVEPPSESPKHLPPPWILTHPSGKPSYFDKFENFHKPYHSTGLIKITGTKAPDNMMGNVVYGTIVKSPPEVANTKPEVESKGISTNVTIAMCSIFLLSNLCLFIFLYIACYRKRKIRNEAKTDETITVDEEVEEAKLMAGCNIVKMYSKSERSEDTYEAVKSSGAGRYKVQRQMSSSTIDAHTKVRDWITNEIVNKYSPKFLRRPKPPKIDSTETEKTSTLGKTPTRPVSPVEISHSRPPLLKSSSIPSAKKQVEKVSVAIDATPSGRGPSVLAQQPIELTKSLDRPNFEPLRRSLTLEDFSIIENHNLRKSTNSYTDLKMTDEVPTVVRIEHAHSKSDPVQDFSPRKLITFDPNADVNVTSREEEEDKLPLTPEESLMTIKRRKFPKVLPDYPSKESMSKKRRSMPVHPNFFTPIPEAGSYEPGSPTHKTFGKLPPAPPLRTSSTLTRRSPGVVQPVCQSAPMLAQEPPPSPEPEVSCNNLYVGPLIPKLKKTELSSSESSKLNTQPIYDKLKVVTASQPVKRNEPKVIIKPTMTRTTSDPKKKIPRVNLSEEEGKKYLKPSHIPTLCKGKESSSSESPPSEESDTGTIVKKV